MFSLTFVYGNCSWERGIWKWEAKQASTSAHTLDWCLWCHHHLNMYACLRPTWFSGLPAILSLNPKFFRQVLILLNFFFFQSVRLIKFSTVSLNLCQDVPYDYICKERGLPCHIIPGISVFGLEGMAAALVVLLGLAEAFPGLVTHQEKCWFRTAYGSWLRLQFWDWQIQSWKKQTNDVLSLWVAVIITSEAYWNCLIGEIPGVFLALLYGFGLALFYRGQKSIQAPSGKRRMILRVI